MTSFADLRGLDRATIIASQSFTALIPLLILVSAALPTGSSNAVAEAVVRRFELTGDAAGSVEAVFAQGFGALVVEIALLHAVRTLVVGLPLGWAWGAPSAVAVSIALWTSVPYLLLDRRVPWRRLLPAGVLTGVGVALYSLVSTVYMSRLMTSYSERYGLFGVTVAIVGWLLCTCLVVVTATVVAAELDRAPEDWARRLRARLGAQS